MNSKPFLIDSNPEMETMAQAGWKVGQRDRLTGEASCADGVIVGSHGKIQNHERSVETTDSLHRILGYDAGVTEMEIEKQFEESQTLPS